MAGCWRSGYTRGILQQVYCNMLLLLHVDNIKEVGNWRKVVYWASPKVPFKMTQRRTLHGVLATDTVITVPVPFRHRVLEKGWRLCTQTETVVVFVFQMSLCTWTCWWNSLQRSERVSLCVYLCCIVNGSPSRVLVNFLFGLAELFGLLGEIKLHVLLGG